MGRASRAVNLSVEAAAVAHFFCIAALFLAVQPPGFRCQRWPSRAAYLGAMRGVAKQGDETVDRILPIALLRAELLGVNDDYAIFGHALAGKRDKTRLHVGREWSALRIEP